MDLRDEVVRDAAAGDPHAFRLLYDAVAPRVLAYLRARGVDDPEGLTSEVFLAVFPRLPRLEGGAAGLRTLVFSVAHARAVDDVRRRQRHPVSYPYEPDHDDRVVASAEHHAVESLEAGRALALMDRLGEDQRAAVMLRIIGDLTLEETAGVMGKTVPAVKQLQRRGLEHLRRLMTAEGAR